MEARKGDLRRLQLDREHRGVPPHHGTVEPAKNPPGQGEVDAGGFNSPDQVGIARLVPRAEEGGLHGLAEGGKLGEGFGVRGGEGVGDGKIARGEVLGANVGDVGVEHCTSGLGAAAGADVGSGTTVTFFPLPFVGCFAGIKRIKW